jgi:pimeloyl-ACP methyl ester carboxylesterase
VAVHGNFASKRWFEPLLAQPPAGVTVHALDLPGFGSQARWGDDKPSIPRLANALARFVAEQALDRPLLLGHSLGGAVVAELAHRDPSRFRGLVLVSSAHLDGFRMSLAHAAALKLYQGNRTLLRKALQVLFAQPLPGSFEALVDDALGLHPAGYTGNARALSAWSVVEHLAALRRLPTLILGGERDPLIKPAEVRRMGTQLPQATVKLFAHIGHALPLEDPALLRHELEAFAGQLAP